MKTSNYDDRLGFGHVKDAVREATEKRAADAVMYDSVHLWVSLNRRQRRVDRPKKLIAESLGPRFVIVVRLAEFGLGFGSNNYVHSATCPVMRARTSAQDAPSVGVTW